MLDFGWSELFVIAVVGILALGPKELPGLMYGFGKLIRRFRYMRHALSSQFEDFMAEAEAAEKRRKDGSQPREDTGEAEADFHLAEMLPEAKPAPADKDPAA